MKAWMRINLLTIIYQILNKKLIFINPHAKYDWHYSDIEKEFRPGFICNQFEEIINSIKDYKNNKDPYAEERKNFIEKIFFNPSTNANIKIAQIIDEITTRRRAQYSER